MTRKLYPGSRVGPWELLYFFGRGGGGEVWAAENASGVKVALKVMRTPHYRARFLDEISLYKRISGRPGILPLIDSHIPSSRSEKSKLQPWIAMKIATPVTDYLGPTPDLAVVVSCIARFAETLASLAKENIFHRDIKPANLYWLDDEFVIGDFGIADFPEKSGLTEIGEKVGPANFLAPEMIEYSGETRSGPADVYSLAKTLWALAAARRYPPPGELLRDNEAFRLSSHVSDPNAYMLEALIEAATKHDPDLRPTMSSFLEELIWWSQPTVQSKVDLSHYRDEVERIRAAKTIIKRETAEERRNRLREEAGLAVYKGIFVPVGNALQSVGLVHTTPVDDSRFEWPMGDQYSGSWSSGYWGIAGLANPWLECHLGVLQRENPLRDVNDIRLAALLVLGNPGNRTNWKYYSEQIEPGSIKLVRQIERIRGEIEASLSDVIKNYLEECKRGEDRDI